MLLQPRCQAVEICYEEDKSLGKQRVYRDWIFSDEIIQPEKSYLNEVFKLKATRMWLRQRRAKLLKPPRPIS
jgi:hypothetical protein